MNAGTALLLMTRTLHYLIYARLPCRIYVISSRDGGQLPYGITLEGKNKDQCHEMVGSLYRGSFLFKIPNTWGLD